MFSKSGRHLCTLQTGISFSSHIILVLAYIPVPSFPNTLDPVALRTEGQEWIPLLWSMPEGYLVGVFLQRKCSEML